MSDSCNKADDIDNFYVTGYTGFTSTTLDLITNPSFIYSQTIEDGGSDDAILCFNSNGQRKWTTYFGGDGTEYLYSAGYPYQHSKFYLVGTTQSQLNFPLNDLGSGAHYQDTFPPYATGMAFISEFDIQGVVGVDDVENQIESTIKVFPNPNLGDFIVQLSDANGKVEVTLYSTIGQQVYFKEYEATSSIQVSIPQLHGIYLLKVATENSIATTKIIIE